MQKEQETGKELYERSITEFQKYFSIARKNMSELVIYLELFKSLQITSYSENEVVVRSRLT